MIDLDLDDLRTWFGLGVAGNFAGHLEQAGEAGDFVSVAPVAPDAPKGIFPFYVPGGETFLGAFPLSHDRIARPVLGGPAGLQLEPEVGLVCGVAYAADGTVDRLVPRGLGAFNDCSIRRPGAAKISEKKSWGPDSKGIARRLFTAPNLEPDGPTRSLRLACFLRREGETHAYGIDSPLPGYTYYGRRLLDWTRERLVHQTGSPDTPLEPVGSLLAAAGRPDTVLIGIGATRYTPFGAVTYLKADDESVIVVYDARTTSPDGVRDAVTDGRADELETASVLRQTVYDAG